MYAEIELEMTKDKYVHKFSVRSSGVHLALGHFKSHHNVWAQRATMGETVLQSDRHRDRTMKKNRQSVHSFVYFF